MARPRDTQPELAAGRGRSITSKLLALGIGLAILAMIVAGGLRHPRHLTDPKVTIGSKDEVYYSLAATREDAEALGQALRILGFFSDRGTSVLLSKSRGGSVVSFVLNDGAWDRPETAANFEEIGRRIATAVGGFPIKVRFVDSAWVLRKEMAVGRVIIGGSDVIYYFGAATQADAAALGMALTRAGFLIDRGITVEIAKGDGTAVSFVVADHVWERPDAVAGFERLVQQAAPAIGGLPIKLRLLNPQMEVKREEAVH